MKNLVILIVGSLCLLFCSSTEDSSLFGTYTSPNGSNINALRYGAYAVGLELELKRDSTYTFSTCAQISNGKWTVKKNELILLCQEIRFINDSINNLEKYAKGKICGEEEIFKIDKNKLSRSDKSKVGKELKFILLKN